MTFEEALVELKMGKEVAREGWGDKDISIEAQYPDKNSKMTNPYLFMNKFAQKFPCDLSCESIFADDWIVVNDLEGNEVVSAIHQNSQMSTMVTEQLLNLKDELEEISRNIKYLMRRI